MPPLHKYKNKEIKLAFKRDCEKLLNEFQGLQTFSFPEFAKIWKKHSFSCVYTPFETDEEYATFAEIAYFLLKKYLVFPKNIYTQIGSLYMLYGLYFKQPIMALKKIRLTLPDYRIIREMINQMYASQQFDPVYVFCKMQYEDAFQYIFLDLVLAPDLKHYSVQFTKNNDVFEMAPADSLKGAYKSLLESNMVEIEKVDNEYRNCLEQFKGSFLEADKLQTFNTNPAAEVKALFEESTNAQTQDESKEEDKLGKARKNIKKKAMALQNPEFRSHYTINLKSNVGDE